MQKAQMEWKKEDAWGRDNNVYKPPQPPTTTTATATATKTTTKDQGCQRTTTISLRKRKTSALEIQLN